ncbi:MAG: LamG domain-containing protein [Akkermansiaceae bacterium]|nr:LamG domain-containing protein [Armatimonadota bacterium]
MPRNHKPMTIPEEFPDLISFWDFSEPTGKERVARGAHPYRLRDSDPKKPVARVEEGIFGSHSARILPGSAFHIPRAECPALNLHGAKAQVSLVAWIKREPSPNAWSCQAVAGMWNEHSKRQYCLFLNLQIWDSKEQVGAHISAVGGATPGYKYCMDAAIGATPVPLGKWQCVAITYDGKYARAFINGKLDSRGGDGGSGSGGRNPYRYDGGIFDGGPDGADFTVGAVLRPAKVDDDHREHGSVLANNYHGLLGGLAVYRRALTDEEIRKLAG